MDFKFPCHWSYQEAQDFCLKIADGTHDSPKETTFGKQLVTSKNIIGGYLNLSNTYLISEKDYDQINKRSKVDKFDILLSMIGTVGQICLVEQEPNFAIKNVGLLKNTDELKARYLYYYLSSIPAQNAIKKRLRGTTQQYLTLGEIRKFPIHYPPEKEMGQIVTILNKLDKKITLNNQINETLEAMAQALFKSWFIDFEPVKAKIEAKDAGQDAEGIHLAAMSAISGKEIEALKVLQTTAPEEYAELKAIAEQFPDSLEESELGLIPKGWEVRSFFNWIEPKRGKSITKKKVIPGNIPVVAGGLEPAYYHNEHNVIGPAITISASGANAGFINLYFENIWSSDSSYISSKETECIFTAYILLKLRQTDIFKMQTGAAQPHIYPKDFERLFFTYPGMSLFSQFEKYICSSFQKIGKNIQQNKTLTELRDTLLPKLLSGEIDVSNVEIDELLENEA